MTQDPTIEPADEDPPADPTHAPPAAEHAEEVSRIAALLRDRFGIEH